jgi:anhydro-N-acetylmuramic acid kinase
MVGVMSGTSVDGVDGVLCRCQPGSVKPERGWSRKFPKALAMRLHAAARGESGAWECGQLHHDLGRFYAETVADGLAGEAIDGIGLHGQTVFHRPDRHRPATWQIGEPAWLAERLGVPVVSNFRVGDLAAGGQGAPLATLFHRIVFAERGAWTAVQNLGGIGNVTHMDFTAGEAEPTVRAFDTGPANVLLDLASRAVTAGREAYDRDGRRAAGGRVDEVRLAAWMRHRFIRRRPPKSTGREEFGEPFFRAVLKEWPGAMAGGGHDLMATLTEFTAASVVENYRRHLTKPGGGKARVILCGGGAANGHLVRRLGERLQAWSPGVRLMTVDELGWGRQMIEPAAFALLGAYRLWGLPGNLPGTTGAAGPRLLGQVT